jgi:hypothetical protein
VGANHHQDEPSQPPLRKGGIAGLLQRLLPAQQVPAPFRESDFEASEWRWSTFDPPPGRAAE